MTDPSNHVSMAAYERVCSYMGKRAMESLYDCAVRTLDENWRGRRREAARMLVDGRDGSWATIHRVCELLENDPITGIISTSSRDQEENS